MFGDNHLIPDTAILDPELTINLPADITAATGMDALSHAIESIHSLQRQPIADGLALAAIRMIFRYLPQCVENGNDIAARGQQRDCSNNGRHCLFQCPARGLSMQWRMQLAENLAFLMALQTLYYFRMEWGIILVSVKRSIQRLQMQSRHRCS